MTVVQVVDSYGGDVLLAKIDIDENQELASAFQVGFPSPYSLNGLTAPISTSLYESHVLPRCRQFLT
jgi:hypothetical protein